ncbi:MAG: M28 family peptidase [Myxococcota bacterium]
MLACWVRSAVAGAFLLGCGAGPAPAAPRVDRAALEADLRAVAVPRADPASRARTAALVASRFVGCAVRSEGGTVLCERGEAPFVYVAAHHDAVEGTPGADDDATGVAGVLAVARALSPLACGRGLRFVVFDGEETGLDGSRAHVATLDPDDVHGAIVLEMIGYTGPRQVYPPGLSTAYFWRDFPETGDFLAVLGDFRSRGLVAEVAAAASPRVKVEGLHLPPGVSLPDFRRSDHAPFWDAGIPAVMVTDTANFRNPHYHRASDTVESLDLVFFGDAVDAAVAATARVAACG